MSVRPVPAVILGGSDRKPARLPRGSDKHALTGYKGARVRLGDRPLVAVITERLAATGFFAPIHVAGPRRVYEGLCPGAQLIDTDGSFGENIRTATETIRSALPGHPVAFVTCDVLPSVDEWKALADDYSASAPSDLWFPLVRVPADPSRLGASEWKPRYRIRASPDAPVEEMLPGHLVIADPAALRLAFIYRLFEIGYSTRNRSVSFRRTVMVRSVLAELLLQDLLHVLGLRLPTLTLSVLGSGLRSAQHLKEGTATRPELEDTLRRIFVRKRHRRQHPDRRILLPAVDVLSLAIDVDTVEEARALGADVAENSASSR